MTAWATAATRDHSEDFLAEAERNKKLKESFLVSLSPYKSVNVQKFTMVESGAFLFCWHCIMRVFLVGLLVTVYNIWTSILDYTVGQNQGWRTKQEDNCHLWNIIVLEQKGVQWITVLLFQHSHVQIPLTYIWSDAGKPGSRHSFHESWGKAIEENINLLISSIQESTKNLL